MHRCGKEALPPWEGLLALGPTVLGPVVFVETTDLVSDSVLIYILLIQTSNQG